MSEYTKSNAAILKGRTTVTVNWTKQMQILISSIYSKIYLIYYPV